jgi:hypothetical protein
LLEREASGRVWGLAPGRGWGLWCFLMVPETYICPTCGSEVRVGGTCPGCAPVRKPRRRKVAASGKKPWERDEMYDGLDLPDEDFDSDGFVARELGKAPHRKIGIKLYHWITALVLVLLLLLMALGGVFG